MFYIFILSIVTLGGATGKMYERVLYEESAPEQQRLNASIKYCYHFTWLNRDEASFTPFLNKTCEQVFATTRPMPLCVNPLVASHDGTEPDWDLLYNNNTHLPALVCRPKTGEVCAKYSVIFNGAVQNVTRTCTKVKVDDTPKNSGPCVIDDRGAYTTEVCACESGNGERPCNSAHHIIPSFAALMAYVLFLFLYLDKYLYNN